MGVQGIHGALLSHTSRMRVRGSSGHDSSTTVNIVIFRTTTSCAPSCSQVVLPARLPYGQLAGKPTGCFLLGACLSSDVKVASSTIAASRCASGATPPAGASGLIPGDGRRARFLAPLQRRGLCQCGFLPRGNIRSRVMRTPQLHDAGCHNLPHYRKLRSKWLAGRPFSQIAMWPAC